MGQNEQYKQKEQTRIACLHCCEFFCLPFLDWHRARTPLRLGFLHDNMHKWFITFHSLYEIWNVKFIAFMAVLHVSSILASFHVFGYRSVSTFGLTFGYFNKKYGTRMGCDEQKPPLLISDFRVSGHAIDGFFFFKITEKYHVTNQVNVL